MLACLTPSADAVGVKVAINISTQTSSPLAAGFSGYNTPQLRNGVEYYDPKFVAAVAPLFPGWLRFPAGTASMAYDWNPQDSYGGHIDIDWMNSLIDGNPPLVTGQAATVLLGSQPLTQAKGGVYLSDFARFVNRFGAKAILCFNAFTDTSPNSATLLAQAAQHAKIKVKEWELANEAYLYPLIYPSAASYATAVYNPYFNDIVAATPNATIGLFMAGTFTGSTTCPTTPSCAAWDSGIAAFTPRYWNALSMHVYPIDTVLGITHTIELLNGILAHGTGEYITSYVDPLFGTNTPIFITEFNCCAPNTDQFLTFLYNGVFLAEYTARMSTVRNVKAVGVNSLYTESTDYHGLIQAANSPAIVSYLLGQIAKNPNYSTDTATDPNTQYQFYTSAPGLAMAVVNHAINNSTATWPTTITGGPTVPIQGYDGQPIPAIYAQAYEGKGGGAYVVITNKSAATCTATIQVNGVEVGATMGVLWVSNPSALVANTPQQQNNVQIQNTTSANPITIGPYSVTVVKW